jgi:hypothetical protein
MVPVKNGPEAMLLNVLVNYLVSQARTDESWLNRALWSLRERDARVAAPCTALTGNPRPAAPRQGRFRAHRAARMRFNAGPCWGGAFRVRP